MNRRHALLLMASAPLLGAKAAAAPETQDVLATWYKLALMLTRHTPIYSPPVASRTFAYLGVAAYEAIASGSKTLQSLSGQLHGLAKTPAREAEAAYDDNVILNA